MFGLFEDKPVGIIGHITSFLTGIDPLICGGVACGIAAVSAIVTHLNNKKHEKEIAELRAKIKEQQDERIIKEFRDFREMVNNDEILKEEPTIEDLSLNSEKEPTFEDLRSSTDDQMRKFKDDISKMMNEQTKYLLEQIQKVNEQKQKSCEFNHLSM